MEKQKRHLSPSLFFIIGNLVLFIFAHLDFLLETAFTGVALLYLEKIWNMLFPPLAAIFTLSKMRSRGTLSLFISPFLFALTKAFYYFLYYYEYLVIDGYITSSEALLDSCVLTGAVILISYVHILIYVLTSSLVLKLFAQNRDRGSTEHSPYDFSDPVTLASLTPAVLGLIYTLVFEILDTVSFIRSYFSTATVTEILTITVNYLLIIGIHLLLYFLSVKDSLPAYYKSGDE